MLVVKAMKYRDVRKALLAHGCRSTPGKGDHEWFCACGQHVAVVTRGGSVSAGVVGDVVKKLTCLPRGW
jgi:hypothetical protein